MAPGGSSQPLPDLGLEGLFLAENRVQRVAHQ